MRSSFMVFMALTVCVTMFAQQKNSTRRLNVVNGMFFYEIPEEKADVRVIYGSVKDSVWGSILVSGYSKGLSDSSKRLSVPVDEVENGKEILQRAKELKISRTRHLMYGSDSPVKVGDDFPDFSLSDIEGRKWEKKNLTGKKVVINFWYTGCGPCRKEMPELGSWVSQYPDVLFLAITFEDAEKIRKVVTDRKFYFHQLVNAGKLMKQVGVSQYPLTVVLDEAGKIICLELGTSPAQRANILRVLK